jgi:hypothetical protein
MACYGVAIATCNIRIPIGLEVFTIKNFGHLYCLIIQRAESALVADDH